MRVRNILFLSCLALVTVPSFAKFGVFKTKVVLDRMRPPEDPPIGATVYLDVRSVTPEITGAHESMVRERLEAALRGEGSPYALVDRKSQADVAVAVVLRSLTAEIRDEIRTERKRIKVGERQVWNEKKKRNENEDVYENRNVPVPWRIAEGRVEASIRVGDGNPHAIGGSFDKEMEKEEYAKIPEQLRSEESLRSSLIDKVAARAHAVVAFSPDPVEALLAVNGELKDGNRLAEAGQFEAALGEWTRRTYKGDTEAARLHNVGVAHEAIAYGMPPDLPEHRSRIELARDFYRQAMSIDPDEKYFKESLSRIETTLTYATEAARIAEELRRHSPSRERRTAAPPSRSRPTPAAPDPSPSSSPVARSVTPTGSAAGPASTGASARPLRNGSFESGLPPWAVSGNGKLLDEAKRGRILELGGGASLAQSVDVAIPASVTANLSLDYRVTADEGRIQVSVSYVDVQGKSRNATLPVTAGEGPGAWSGWVNDLAALRPRPARIREVQVVVEGGTARIDNVALTLR